MRSAGFVLILGVKPCPRATPLGPGVHFASQHLTSLAPHPLHKPTNGRRCPWSTAVDHIFRNEGATGSNPVSSTIRLSGRTPIAPGVPSGTELERLVEGHRRAARERWRARTCPEPMDTVDVSVVPGDHGMQSGRGL